MSENIWCEVKAVPCTCKGGVCPNTKLVKVEEPIVKERKSRDNRTDKR